MRFEEVLREARRNKTGAILITKKRPSLNTR